MCTRALAPAPAIALALIIAAGCFTDPGSPLGGDEASATASTESATSTSTTSTTSTSSTSSTSATSTTGTTAVTSTTSEATTSTASTGATSTASTTTGADTDATGTTGGAGVEDICPALCLKQFECGQKVDESCVVQCIAALSASSAACVDAYAELAQCATPLACGAIEQGCRKPTNEVTLACQECKTSLLHDLETCSVAFSCTDAVYSMVCDDFSCTCNVDGMATGFCAGLGKCALDDQALAELAVGCCDWTP